MKNGIIGAEHDFHDSEFALGWAERFEPTTERLRLFDMIMTELSHRIPANGQVLELGIGPGYLARHLLESMPAIEYHGIDFSRPMLEIARKRLENFSARITFTQTDLVKDTWEDTSSVPFDAIISTWALHDLGSPENIGLVYRKSFKVLGKDGILLNGDFIKPEGTTHEFEAGRFRVSKHLAMLKDSGFKNAECLAIFEQETVSPTPAQNYACLLSIK